MSPVGAIPNNPLALNDLQRQPKFAVLDEDWPGGYAPMIDGEDADLGHWGNEMEMEGIAAIGGSNNGVVC